MGPQGFETFAALPCHKPFSIRADSSVTVLQTSFIFPSSSMSTHQQHCYHRRHHHHHHHNFNHRFIPFFHASFCSSLNFCRLFYLSFFILSQTCPGHTFVHTVQTRVIKPQPFAGFPEELFTDVALLEII